MRVARGDWAAGSIRPTWRVVWGLICAASLTGNLVLLWPGLTLLASSISQFLLTTLNTVSHVSLLFSYQLTPDLLCFLVSRPHLYVLLNLILMRIVYRSGILSRPPPPASASTLPCNTYSKKPQLYPIHLPGHGHYQFQAENHEISYNQINPQQDLHLYLTPARSLTSLDASSCVNPHAAGPMVVVVDLVAKKETLQKSMGAMPEVLTSHGETLPNITKNDDHDHPPRHYHHLLRRNGNRSKQQQQPGCLHDEAAVAATASPDQTMNIMVKKKDKIRNKRPSLFSIEPLSSTMSDGDQPDAQPHPDKKMTRSYTINANSKSSPFSAAASAGPSFQRRSASEARRRSKVLAVADYPNANYSVNGMHREVETKPSSLTHSADHPYYDLSREEFNTTVETFISKFRKKLSMQRQDSFNRLLGLVNGIQ